MTQQTIGLHVNPSNETIRLGPLAVRFLTAGENSSGTVAAFELIVPGAQRLAAPAHSHDHYEETIYGIDGVLTWTVDGKQIEGGTGQALCIPRGAKDWLRVVLGDLRRRLGIVGFGKIFKDLVIFRS